MQINIKENKTTNNRLNIETLIVALATIGFNLKQTIADIKKNWTWVLLVAVGSPVLTLILSKLFLPQYVEHVKGRLPVDISVIIPAIITITIGTFLEEIIFRGFLQERLGWIVGFIPALVISSILFAFMHFSTGSFSIVAFDMAGIFIDSILYGIIYNKTKNICASWIGHYVADIVAIIIVLTMF